jgi:cell wall-associated NlpC family hydrolase
VVAPAPAAPPPPAEELLPTTDNRVGCDLVGAATAGTVVPGESPAQAGAVATTLNLLGTPYVWGGESRRGFDCSGLVQWVYSTVGVRLPRVAQAQYDAGPAVPPGTLVVPGDLVFFGTSAHDVEHVGMFVGNGLMVDAPHTGAVVRLDRISGFAPLVGVTAPGGHQTA